MILILVALICGSDGSLNDKVVEFARSKMGQQVGNGQCTALAAEALRHSGGSRRGARKGVWGDELESLRDAKPGDILQFEDVVFVGRRRQDDGAILTQNAAVAAPYGHHRSSAEAGDEADTGHPASERE